MVTRQKKTNSLDYCHRCGGLMITETMADSEMLGSRCVICGERVDPVILAHRQQRDARKEAEQLFERGARTA